MTEVHNCTENSVAGALGPTKVLTWSPYSPAWPVSSSGRIRHSNFSRALTVVCASSRESATSCWRLLLRLRHLIPSKPDRVTFPPNFHTLPAQHPIAFDKESPKSCNMAQSGAGMTLRTPEEALNCVDSTIFAEVELTHHWTLQPPLADYLDIHRSISLRPLCDASLNEEYAGNSLLSAFLTCTDRTRVYWRSNCDGAMEPCSSTVYTRVCQTCGHPAKNGVDCGRCANR